MPIFTTQVSGSTYTHLSGTISLSGSHYNDAAGALNPPLFQVTGSVGIERNLRVSGSLMVSSSLLISGTARFDGRAGGVQAYFTDKKGYAETQIASSNGGSLQIKHADVPAYGVFAPTVKLYKSRGTLDSPTPLNDGDRIGNIEFWAYDNSWARSAIILVEATANHGDSSVDVPSNMQFFVAENGNDASSDDTPVLTLVHSGTGTGGLVAHTGGNLRVGGNEIENSEGETTIIMTADQKVGVGPSPGGSWPSYMLDVNGDIRIRGNDIRNSDGDATISMDSSQNVTLAGNLDLAKSGATLLTIGDDSDDDNRKITFGHATTKTVMGINDSRDTFQIHTGADFDASPDLELDNSGNVTIGNGSLYVDGEVWGKDSTQLKLNSNADVIVKVDADNNTGGKKFKVNNHSDTEKFSVSMAGVASAAGAIYAGGNARISGSIYLDDGGMFMGMSSNDLQVTSKGNIEFFVDNDVTTPGSNSFLIYSGSIANTIPLFAVTEAEGVDVGTTLIGGDLKLGQNIIRDSGNIQSLYFSGSGDVAVARNLILWGDALAASGSSGVIDIEGQVTVTSGSTRSMSVCTNSGDSSSVADRWFKIAQLDGGLANFRQAKTSILVTMVGPEISNLYDSNDTFLLNVSFNPTTGSPWYNEEGTGILVDSWDGVADMEGFDPALDVAMSFSNSGLPGIVELWIRSKESYRTVYTSILGGNTRVLGQYTSAGGGFHLLSDQTPEASITSLGQEVYGSWTSKSFTDVHISKIYSDFPTGGNEVLSFSGSNINSNATNPVNIMATGNGVTPKLQITSRATSQTAGPEFNMRKYANDGTLANGENLGEIRFLAATGSAPHGFDTVDYGIAAAIIGEVGTGTWTDGVSQPGQIDFYTTSDGAASGTRRMRIGSDGGVVIEPSTGTQLATMLISSGSTDIPVSIDGHRNYMQWSMSLSTGDDQTEKIVMSTPASTSDATKSTLTAPLQWRYCWIAPANGFIELVEAVPQANIGSSFVGVSSTIKWYKVNKSTVSDVSGLSHFASDTTAMGRNTNISSYRAGRPCTFDFGASNGRFEAGDRIWMSFTAGSDDFYNDDGSAYNSTNYIMFQIIYVLEETELTT